MNNLISTNMGSNINFGDRTFDYTYPKGLNLHPDSKQHKALLSEILDSAKEAYDVISERFPAWKELDEKLTVYIDLSAEDESVRGDDPSKPVAIVVPITYATRETLLTYWTAAFMQHPLFRYQPSHDPKDTLGVLMLENVINQDMIRSKGGLALYTHWSDAFTYGFGAISPNWKTEMGFRTTYNEVTERVLGFPVERRSIKTREQVKQFEGNELLTLDPYTCLPDPNVPIQNVKDMDYFGWTERTNFNSLLTEENLSDGSMFNVKYLKGMQGKTSRFFVADDSETGRYSQTGINLQQKGSTKITDLINMYMWVVPKDFGLGNSEYPELWQFVVAADRVIIQAQQLQLDHNSIPVCVMAPGSDGHTTLPVSILEREYPLQHAIDWLWKSHVANVRKAINNMLIVDPSLINMNDLTDTKFGMLARTRAAAWGRGNLDDAVKQLKVDDVTRGHINDIGFLMNIDNLVFTSNQAKGSQERKGERVSATEARDTRMSFLGKMEKEAKIGSMQSHYDIAYQLAANTIQLLEDDKYIKLTGDYKRVLQEEFGQSANYYVVEPKALDVRYDVVPQDGSMPGGEYADVWERLMNNAATHPDLYKQVDFVRVWLHIARLLGAKNPGDFLKNSRVAPNEEIQEGVRKGDVVPANQMEGVKVG